MRRYSIIGLAAVLGVTVGIAFSQQSKGAQPKVVGKWTGMWGPYSSDPAIASRYSAAQKQIDSEVVVLPNGEWQATFEGECGRPYKYTIKMLGRQAADAVLFKGTTDLGEKDGGVYDWIGRATEQGFVGFFTSAKYAGTFTLARPKDAAGAKTEK